MKFTGQIRIPDLDHPGVPATFLIEGTQAEVILEGEESLGRWSLFDVQARRLISAAFEVELDGEEVTFIADEPIDFAYRGLEEMAEAWARFKAMNIVRRKVAVSRSRNGARPSRVSELRAAMEENLGLRARSVSLPGTAEQTATEPEVTDAHVWDPPSREPLEEPETPLREPTSAGADPDVEPTIPLIATPDDAETLEESDEAASLNAESKAIEEERARLDELRAGDDGTDEEAAVLAAERKAIEEERARLAEERKRLEELQRETERREEDRVEAFRLEMQRLKRERKEFERLEEERQQSHRKAMEALETERLEIEKKTSEMSERELEDAERAAELQAKLAEMSQRELEDAERAAELQDKLAEMTQREREDAEQAAQLQAKLSELEQERIRREQAESERVEAARREIEALEEQQRRMESIEELKGDAPEPGVSAEEEEPEEVAAVAAAEGEPEPSTLAIEPEPGDSVEEESRDETSAAEEGEPEQVDADSEVVDLAELEERSADEEVDTAEDDDRAGPKHLREPRRSRRASSKTQQDTAPQPELPSAPEPVPGPAPDAAPEPEPAMAGAAKQSGIMGAVRAAFGRGGREHVHDFVEAPGGLGIARSICRECGYVSISTEE